MEHSALQFLPLRKIGPLTLAWQIVLIGFLYVASTILSYAEFKTYGTMFGYPVSVTMLFVPIYEEVIFRGLLLGFFVERLGKKKAVIIVSLLFALWHLKNIFFLPVPALVYQMAVTGLIISPIFCYVTLRTKTIWLAVILHYLINLLVFVSVFS